MKTGLRVQVDLVKAIEAEDSLPRKVQLLRNWLKEYGYEDGSECIHPIIDRTRGKCHSCGRRVSEPFGLSQLGGI